MLLSPDFIKKKVEEALGIDWNKDGRIDGTAQCYRSH